MIKDQAFKNQTLQLLRSRPINLTIRQIIKDTGLTRDWILKFQQDKIDGKYKVAEIKIRILHEYLIKKQQEQPRFVL